MKESIVFDANSSRTATGVLLDGRYLPLTNSATAVNGDTIAISVSVDGAWTDATLLDANGEMIPWPARKMMAMDIIDRFARDLARRFPAE